MQYLGEQPMTPLRAKQTPDVQAAHQHVRALLFLRIRSFRGARICRCGYDMMPAAALLRRVSMEILTSAAVGKRRR